MVFNSYSFVAFLAVVLGAYFVLRSWNHRKVLLLVASYVFYGVWNPPFVLLLVLSTVVDWYAARFIASATNQQRRKLWMVVSLCVNLGVLGVFKYTDFLLRTFQGAALAIGIRFEPVQLGLVLPVGISFYTFQTLSYTIDVYRRAMRPATSFLDYALYVTFFPQLVAGPIVRAVDFLPQCTEEKPFDAGRLAWGMTLFMIGLVQKVVLADGFFAPVAERLYSSPRLPSFVDAWVGTLAFAGQIYCDFAGYSTCAIGIALAMGFTLRTNFHYPYAAIGFSDFWRRWHISLSSWLRDYLYIPLGGNRHGRARTNVNLMLTMLLGGLWHGASWTFVAWGGLHGGYLILERAIRQHVAPRLPKSRAIALGAGLGTFALVCVTWVFFRADSFGRAFVVVRAMLGFGPSTERILSAQDVATTVALMGTVLAYQWWMRERTLSGVVSRLRWPVRAVALAAMLLAVANLSGDDRAFIYFQF